jgi:hypothetical protein
MTAATLDFSNKFTNPFVGVAIGVSDVARSITSKIADYNSSKLKTVTGSQEASIPSQAFEGLLDILDEGECISYEIFSEAVGFLKHLPASFDVPDIGIEPSGAITFEWYKNPFKVFVISLNGTSTLEFAALSGRGNELHGKMNFTVEMPNQLKVALQTFLSA